MLDISIEFSAIRLSGINHILHPELILYSGLLPVKSLLFTVCRHCFHSPGVTLFRTNTHSTTLPLEINLYVSNKHHDFSPCLWPWVLYFWHLPNISVQTVSDGTDSSKIKIILRKPTCSIVLLFAFFFSLQGIYHWNLDYLLVFPSLHLFSPIIRICLCWSMLPVSF